MPAATDAFVQTLRRLRLFEPGRLDEVERALVAQFPSPKDLLAELERRGWVTAYQAAELRANRGAGLLLGSYVLLDKLGEGGMGEVFKARQTKMGRLVAVKVIHQDRLANPDAARRFEREIRAAAQLDHSNIVRAIDADEIDGRHLFVMEYVEGVDLSTLVKQNGPLPVGTACECIRQAALGLQHAHERGMVHRDVKPGNLLLATPGNTVKLLDMGLVRMEGGGENSYSGTMTAEGSVMGTPDYIAPEQAMESHNVDIRADLYSLGCTLYYLVTGRPPFPGGTMMQKLMKHRLDEPTPVEALRPEVPPGVGAILRRLMMKDPAARYQTPAELAEALSDPSKAAEPTVVPKVRQHAATFVEHNPFTNIDLSDTAHPTPTPKMKPAASSQSRKAPRPLILGGSALAAAMALGLLLLVGRAIFTAKPARTEPQPEVKEVVIKPKDSKPSKEQLAADERRRMALALDRRNLAEGRLATIAAQWHGSRPEDLPRLRREMAEFMVEFSGMPQVMVACGVLGDMLARAPSPLDGLDPAMVPELARAEWTAAGAKPPAELVAVLGDPGAQKQGPVVSVAFAPDGRRLIAGGQGAARVWDLPGGKLVAMLVNPAGPVVFVALLPDGRAVIGGGNLMIRHLDRLEPGNPVGENVVAGALSPDGSRVATSDGARLSVWNVTEGLRLTEGLAEAGGRIASIAFSPNGRLLVSSGTDHFTRFWTLGGNGRPDPAVLGKGQAASNRNCCAFSLDGRLVALDGGDATVRLWDISGPASRELDSLPDVRGSIRSLAFLPDGRLACATSSDHLALWDVTGRRKLREWKLPSVANALAVAPDGRHLATANANGTVSIFRLAPPALPPGGVDLLPLIDPKRDTISGRWKLDGGKLTGGGVEPVTPHNEKLQIPFTPPEEYDLTAVVERMKIGANRAEGDGNRAFTLILPGKKQFQVVLDWQTEAGKVVNGLHVEGVSDPNETAVNADAFNPAGPTRIECRVRRESVTVRVGGKVLIRFAGDMSRLGIHAPYWVVPNKDQFALGVQNAEYCFSELKLMPPSNAEPQPPR